METLAHQILSNLSTPRLVTRVASQSVRGILELGFSLLDSKDVITEFVVMSQETLKKVVYSLYDDFELDLTRKHVGRLWTAEVLVSSKVSLDSVIFTDRALEVILEVRSDNTSK